MTISYAEAGELLADFARAYDTFDGDLVVSLFTPDAEYHEDPFGSPMVGHNAIRAYWLAAAEEQDQVEFTIERHLVSADTVVAIWHLSYVAREDGGRRRASGVLVLDMRDGKIGRLREWWHERRTDTVGGDPATE
ncbi:MAG TPA: nuclear transport factor 2 family protein [Candidatus Limnocylindrales bacterium]|nr:nuclear transport factor 2 family protein [Candidatus Limnocylindrales bacterium]HEX5589203.1 nuclear transport factor 2 family protein [Candidatus Limnocylindrales bacterium]